MVNIYIQGEEMTISFFDFFIKLTIESYSSLSEISFEPVAIYVIAQRHF